MLVSVHPAAFLWDWGFGDFQSLRLSPGEHPIQRIEPSHLVGTPQAIDLNSIAAPPKDTSSPPFRRALRDAMPPDARWIRSLSIE